MPDVLLGLVMGTPLIPMAAATVFGIWGLRAHGMFARFVPVDDLGTVLPVHDPRGLEGLAKEFRDG